MVKNVPVIERKGTMLNFTLEEMLMSDYVLTAKPTVTNEGLNPPGPSIPKTPIQSLDFRYHGYDEIEMLLQLYSAVHPSITYLYSAGRSVQGRSLYGIEISTNPGVNQQGINNC